MKPLLLIILAQYGKYLVYIPGNNSEKNIMYYTGLNSVNKVTI